MISVALPVVKHNYFEKALKSILQQTYNDFELIVVNNDSSGNIDEIVNRYPDKRIRYIKHKPRLPVIENWNKCLEYAAGEYFVLFSDDDFAEPDFLMKMNELALKYPGVNIFHSRVRIIDGNDNLISLTASAPEYETAADFIWHRFKNFRMHYTAEFMCRTETLRNAGGFCDFINAWGSDDATWFTMANTGGIVSSPQFLCNWRFSASNLSSVGSLEAKLKAVQSFGQWSENFVNNILNCSSSDHEIKKEIIRMIPRRIQTQYAGSFRLALGTNISAFYKLFYYWLKFRKKYNLNFYSLVWALMLISKDR